MLKEAQTKIFFGKSEIKIYLANLSGFCFGVENAVKSAYQLIQKSKIQNKNMFDRSSQEEKAMIDCAKIYMLGEITHNEIVVSDLLSTGILLAHTPKEIEPGSTVLIRAHGVSPAIKEQLKNRSCEIVDCTCLFVNKIHDIVRREDQNGKVVLIAGSKGHPEVEGLCGECMQNVCVIGSKEEASAMQFEQKNTVIVSQTTFSANEFDKICEIVKNKIAKIQIFDTICSTTENRQREAEKLAASVDRMIVIGSAKSSNTMKLFDICRSRCAKAYLIGNATDLKDILPDFFSGTSIRSVGITAGASTPECIIREVIRVMSENEVVSNKEQTDIDFEDYVDSIPQLRKNATVKGAITSVDSEYVYVDVHDKSEGRIPRHEFANDPDFDLDAAIAEHLEIEVYVRSVRNSDMGKEILLSKAHVDFGKYKAQVEEAFKEKIPLVVKIGNVVKDGVIAVYGGVDIYIHRTQLEMSTVEDLESYRGKEIEILVTQFDPDKRRLRVSGSRRTLLNQERKAKAEQVWSTIDVGSEYEGVVRSLTDFGAFVDIGGVDGLVHVSELSWNRIRHPSEVVSVGDKLNVFVKEFVPEKKRISLGYKRPEDDPYHDIEARFPVGSIVHGKVVRMFQFGAFVEIAEGVDALCHVSQISNARLNRPEDALTDGMEVDARVLDVSDETRRISISIREVEPIEPKGAQEEGQAVAEETPVNPESFVADDVSAFNSASVVITSDEETQKEVVSEDLAPDKVEESVAEETAVSDEKNDSSVASEEETVEG